MSTTSVKLLPKRLGNNRLQRENSQREECRHLGSAIESRPIRCSGDHRQTQALENAIAIRKSSTGWSGNSNVIATPKARSQERSAKASQENDSGPFFREKVWPAALQRSNYPMKAAASALSKKNASLTHYPAYDSSVELDLSGNGKDVLQETIGKNQHGRCLFAATIKIHSHKHFPIPFSMKKQGNNEKQSTSLTFRRRHSAFG